MNDHKGQTEASKYSGEQIKFKWLRCLMTTTSDFSLPGAPFQSVSVQPVSQRVRGVTSSIPGRLSNLQLLEEGGWLVRGRGRRWEEERDGWREEREAKSVGGGEEAVSYPGGSVTQWSYILRDWFSAAQEVGNAFCWALTPGGKEPCLARYNCKKHEGKKRKATQTRSLKC